MSEDEIESLDEGEEAFCGAVLLNRERITERKSIAICGVARGGTSFGASVFARLGIPMTLPEEPQLPATFEHRALRPAFLAGDFAKIRQLAAKFSNQYPVWAWKLPAIASEFEMIGTCLYNPHFVMIFKEPLSVVARNQALKAGDKTRRVAGVLDRYRRMAALAEKTEHPLLMVSYDRAMSNLEGFLPEAALFGGVSRFDAPRVAARIRADQRRYLRGWRRRQETEREERERSRHRSLQP